MTIPQIKLVTGHKSDSVVQEYIDQSKTMKRSAAAALSVGGCQDVLAPKHQRLTPDEGSNRTNRSSSSSSSSGRSGPTINISFSGCQISAPVNVEVGKEVPEDDEDELSILELIRRRCSPELFEIIKRENDAKFGR